MLMYLLQGLSLGFSAAVSPGPFSAFLLSQTLIGGWRRSLPMTLAPLVSDLPIVAAVMLLLTRIPEGWIRAIQIAGGLLLLYLARGAFDAFRTTAGPAPVEAATRGGGFFKGVAMNALSPGPYLFWSTVLGPIALKSWAQSPALGVGFVGAFYCALIGGLIGFVLLFAAASRIHPRLTRGLNAFAAAALFAFGLYQLWRGAAGV